MIFFAHRINLTEELKKVPLSLGVEIDIRSEGNKIIVTHDPFASGIELKEYLLNINERPIIFNIKCEGLEHTVLDLALKYNIEQYFFLDCSFPMIQKLYNDLNFKKVALRYSEYEGFETLTLMSHRADWVWIDCFHNNILTIENYVKLKSLGYKICVVSPELHGRPEQINIFIDFFKKNKILPDAVCAKLTYFNIWNTLL